MGELMNESGLTEQLIDFCMYLVRPIRGGLGEVNVVASMIFGGISGSSVADTSALGSVLIPEMEKRGYSPEFSAGITVASSTMGMVIPPSIPMIMFSMITGASVGALFMAGAIPGLLVGVLQCIVCYVISKKRGYHPALEKLNVHAMISTLIRSFPAVIMPVIMVHHGTGHLFWYLHCQRSRSRSSILFPDLGLFPVPQTDCKGRYPGS